MAKCEKCGSELTLDEVGLYRKIVVRNAETFLCIPCLAGKFCLPEEDLKNMVERFKRAGCTLFSGI